MNEEKIKIKMDDGVARFSSVASEGICLFVGLWKAQPCLGDPE